MTVVLHISDPHFGTEQERVADALLRLSQEQTPGLVILSGDITQRARPDQFRRAGEFMERLGIPNRLIIPGNHDIPLFDLLARMFRPYGRYRRVFGQDLEPVFESRELLAIGVNTTRAHRHIDGEISAKQIEQVATRLQRASVAQLRIVVTHQPVFVTHVDDRKNLLHGQEAAIRRWAACGADLILGGHIHRPYVCALHENMHDLARRIWAVQAGTALSTRVRYDAGNSVNLIRYRGLGSPRHCSVERWDYSVGTQHFVLAESQELICDA
jgi:3',5'-cyclic AMP phosphodiesterase CpdA